MPKHQSTAARKARAAARRGAKFTPALREQEAKRMTRPSRGRLYCIPTVFDIIGSSAIKAMLDAANGPAMQAAQAAAKVNTSAIQSALDMANSPAMQMYRRWQS